MDTDQILQQLDFDDGGEDLIEVATSGDVGHRLADGFFEIEIQKARVSKILVSPSTYTRLDRCLTLDSENNASSLWGADIVVSNVVPEGMSILVSDSSKIADAYSVMFLDQGEK